MTPKQHATEVARLQHGAVWLPVVGYPNYAVSDEGCVMRTGPGRKPRVLKASPMRPPYLAVTLYRGSTRSSLRVHRLVLQAFVGPCPDGMEACHNNGNPTDNRLANLRWDTQEANIAEQRHVVGEANGQSRYTEAEVSHMRELYATGRYSQQEIANAFGRSRSGVGDVLRRRKWRHVA